MSPRGAAGGGRGAPGGRGGGSGRSGAGGAGRGAAGGGRGSAKPPARGGKPPARRTGAPVRGRASAGAPAAGRTRRAVEREGLGGDQVEGRQAVRELLLAGRRRVHEVVVATEREDAPVLDDILALAGQLQVPVRELGKAKLSALARTESHQGVIARAQPLRDIDLDDLLRPTTPAPFLLACDGVTDPGNLGALLRTAECAGVTGIVLPRHRAVHVSPAVTKAAAGAVEHLRFSLVGGLPAALARAAELGALVIGLDAGGDTALHDLPPVDGPVVVVLGAEGRGLGRLVRSRCDVVAAIPLLGALDSLNVSVAGGLALYEVVRRRAG